MVTLHSSKVQVEFARIGITRPGVPVKRVGSTAVGVGADGVAFGLAGVWGQGCEDEFTSQMPVSAQQTPLLPTPTLGLLVEGFQPSTFAWGRVSDEQRTGGNELGEEGGEEDVPRR